MDLGGSSSLFSYYLASKGLTVQTVDLQENLVDNANYVAKCMGWELQNYVMDMKNITLPGNFEHITSICVFEHIPIYDRVKVNECLKDLLVEGGRFSITFDYLNPSQLAGINSPSDIHEQFAAPSGFRIRGNDNFFDNGKRYLLHPFYYVGIPIQYKQYCVQLGHFDIKELYKLKTENDYTFGALFMENLSP